MVDIIKLKELGYDVEHIANSNYEHNDRMVHHMLKGYKKFNNEYIHLLSDHAHHVLGVEDKEGFREHLLSKAENDEKDDVLHCALSIMSIHHSKKHHEVNGHGVSFSDTHRVVISFLKKATPEKIQEMHDRFPHVTEDVVSSIAPEHITERLYA